MVLDGETDLDRGLLKPNPPDFVSNGTIPGSLGFRKLGVVLIVPVSLLFWRSPLSLFKLEERRGGLGNKYKVLGRMNVRYKVYFQGAGREYTQATDLEVCMPSC